MNKINTFISSSSISATLPRFRSPLIHKNPLCKDCKFFIANTKECGNAADIDLVTGKKMYSYAREIRYDKDKCGEQGKFFEKNNLKMVTVPYYFLLDICPIVLATGVGLMIPIGFILSITNIR